MKQSPVRCGQEFRWTRRVSAQTVTAYAELMGDRASHHVPARGRVVLHGLLVMSLVTEPLACYDFIGSEFTVKFLGPSFADTPLNGFMIADNVEPLGRLGWRLQMSAHVCHRAGRHLLETVGTGIVPWHAGVDA